MSSPVIVPQFGESGQPFSVANLNAAFAALVAAINALATEPLLQHGVTPGNLSGYLPITGGQASGQISAPSLLVGPPGGPTKEVVTKSSGTNADATSSTVSVDSNNPGTVPAGGAGVAAGGWSTAVNRDAAITAMNECITLAIELKGDVNTLKTDLNSLVTRFNALQSVLRTTGPLAT